MSSAGRAEEACGLKWRGTNQISVAEVALWWITYLDSSQLTFIHLHSSTLCNTAYYTYLNAFAFISRHMNPKKLDS